MAAPTLTPSSTTSAIILPTTGTYSNVNSIANPLPLGVYTGPPGSQNSVTFVSGCVDQVSFVFKHLAGDVLDIEMNEYQVYAAYEAAVLEYSYIVNIHQAKNALGSAVGTPTGTFDHDGGLLTGPTGSNLKYPRFEYGFTETIADYTAAKVGVGGSVEFYSASFAITASVQDYDLQAIVYSASLNPESLFYNKVGTNRVFIRKVFYKSPYAFWRFFGYYGGLNVVGNLNSYGQYADDSTFEVIPTWQNKLQAMAFEDSLYTRTSHYSYEIRNNKLRIFPIPSGYSIERMWIQFVIDSDPWTEDADRQTGVSGVNNLNTLPFGNIPYENINSIGKQWIRRFALAICKGMLGQARGKLQSIPIPGDSVTLNHAELLSQSKEEQEKLKEELKVVLDELTYPKLAESEAQIAETASKVLQTIPSAIYVG